VVVDGKTQEMQQDPLGEGFFVYDYRLPNDQDEAAYYFNVRYEYLSRGENKKQDIKSPLHHLKVAARCVFSLESERAPVGTKIPVLGSGFTPEDRVVVGDFACETEFLSRNVICFVVPTLLSGKVYRVYVMGNSDKQFVGNLLIDKGQLHASVESLSLRQGDRLPITFKTDGPVPGTGLYLNTTTDVPDSIIVPEITIPGRSDSVTVTVEAGTPGEGTWFVEASGYETLSIPVSVGENNLTGGGLAPDDGFNSAFNRPPEPTDSSMK
jgi:hypothetical protein